LQLANSSGFQSAYKGLAPSGKIWTHLEYLLEKIVL